MPVQSQKGRPLRDTPESGKGRQEGPTGSGYPMRELTKPPYPKAAIGWEDWGELAYEFKASCRMSKRGIPLLEGIEHEPPLVRERRILPPDSAWYRLRVDEKIQYFSVCKWCQREKAEVQNAYGCTLECESRQSGPSRRHRWLHALP